MQHYVTKRTDAVGGHVIYGPKETSAKRWKAARIGQDTLIPALMRPIRAPRYLVQSINAMLRSSLGGY